MINISFLVRLILRGAHQIPIKADDKPHTAFEVFQRLYQFRRIPFGATNGVANFQRVIDNVILEEDLKDTFAYVDNVTVCRKDQAQHDENLNKFVNAAKKYNLTFNNDKCVF